MSGVTLLVKWRLLSAVAADPGLSAGATKVMIRLLDHHNVKTGRCSPSYGTLATGTAMSRRQVIRTVTELEARGWLIVRRVKGGDPAASQGFVTNGFKLPLEQFEDDTPPGDTHDTPPGDTGDTPPGDVGDTPGVTPTSPPGVSPVSPKTSKRTFKGNQESRDPSAFDRFWQAYPRKVGKSAAERVFLRILRDGKATAEDLIAGAERFARERSREDPTFTKHPQTWLNAGSWLDEPAPRAAPPRPNGRQPFSAVDALMRNFDHDE